MRAASTRREMRCAGDRIPKASSGTEPTVPAPLRCASPATRPSPRSLPGNQHTCALTGEGRAYCWGSNTAGTLGDGTREAKRTPTAVAGSLAFSSISLGGRHSCGVTRSGEAYCWGSNAVGEVGDGTRTLRTQPTRVAGGLTFTAITVGLDHSCGLVANGTTYCWGSNDSGEVGDGERTDGMNQPTRVGGPLSRYTKLSAGYSRTCGVASDGVVYCWGNNERGALGNGKDSLRVVPTRVVGNLQFESLALGSSHACGLTRAGEAHCWGNNAHGQLGDGTTTSRMVPTRVSGTQTFRSITAGGLRTCAVTANGETHCWGQKFGSRIGEPPATGATLTPTVSATSPSGRRRSRATGPPVGRRVSRAPGPLKRGPGASPGAWAFPLPRLIHPHPPKFLAPPVIRLLADPELTAHHRCRLPSRELDFSLSQRRDDLLRRVPSPAHR